MLHAIRSVRDGTPYERFALFPLDFAKEIGHLCFSERTIALDAHLAFLASVVHEICDSHGTNASRNGSDVGTVWANGVEVNIAGDSAVWEAGNTDVDNCGTFHHPCAVGDKIKKLSAAG